MSTGLAAVVLAAGASTRMGRPKALLRWRGRPFVSHAIEQARWAGACPVVVVQGAVPLPDDARPGARLVHNEAWAEGPLGSLQAGLRVLVDDDGTGPAALVLTVDRPHIAAATLRALADAFGRDPSAIWQPQHGDRRGHPILYPADLVAQVLALRATETPRDLLARPPVAARRRSVAVDDPAVLDNLDRPEDLERLPP
ncbi:MAG: nucleotidyltransferase family protein [Nannocystaceae bacterium]